MANLVREPGSEILAQFAVPTRGTWLNTAVHTVPLDAVYNSHNIFVREGKLRNRPGLSLFTPEMPLIAGVSRHMIGGAMGVTPTRKIILAMSFDRLFIFDDVTNLWSTIPWFSAGLQFADTINDVVDIAFMETSSTYDALFAHESRALKVWSTAAILNINTVSGTNIPFAKSICIVASRVIALVAPHTVVWSRVLNYTNFDALAIVKRAQTADTGICVRAISALAFILYKERSIHPARAQAGLDEGAAFIFFEPIIVEGPAGIYAVVDVEGNHIYMTKSGRIAIFDGTNYPKWIADGIWFFLQEDINQSKAHLIRGIYDYRLNIVVFFYPKVTDTVGMTGMVIINLAFPGFEAQTGLTPYSFLGTSLRPIAHVLTKRFDFEIDNSLIFEVPVTTDVTDPLSYSFDEDITADGGLTYPCSFQTGLQAAPDARHVQTTTESFLERAVGYGTVQLIPVTSDTLETQTGTIHTADGQSINLAVPPVNEYIGFNKKTRFFGFQYSWNSVSTVRYSGTVVYDSVKRRK